MNQSNYWISLDINKIHSQLTLSLKQGETGRKIHISLTEDGRPYQISEGCYAYLQARKNDSVNPMSHSCTVENNKIVYSVQPETTSTIGRVDCEIVLCSADGQMIISASFSINIYHTVYTEIEEANEAEKTVLSTLIASVQSKLEDGEFDAGFGEMNVTTTTGEEGTEASVKVTPDENSSNKAKNFNFEFVIPKGDRGEQGIQGIQGEKGDFATVKIGTVTTGKPNTKAVVVNSGTPSEAVLDFTLPIGEQAVRFITKNEAQSPTFKSSDGYIYVLKDDTTLEEINTAIAKKYNYNEDYTDFSTYESLYSAPAGCYISNDVYGLIGTSYTLYIAGTATSCKGVINGDHKTIMAVKKNSGNVYFATLTSAGSVNFKWAAIHHAQEASKAYSATTAETATRATQADSATTADRAAEAEYITGGWTEFDDTPTYAKNAVYLIQAQPSRGGIVTFIGYTDSNRNLKAEYNDIHYETKSVNTSANELCMYVDMYSIDTSTSAKVSGTTYLMNSWVQTEGSTKDSVLTSKHSISTCTLTNIKIKRITT